MSPSAEQEPWECVVVGGGAAGLSAALVLGRSRRRTLVIDAGEQSNLAAEGIGGLLGHDGRPPAELYALGRGELEAYPTVELRVGTVERGERLDDGRFALELAGGGRELTRRVLLATGMDYRLPELPGAAELWGQSVFHCPFCHGWELRDRPLAVLGGGDAGLHRSLLLRGWSDDVVLLADGPAEIDPAGRERLAAAGVDVDERPVAGVVARDGTLAAVSFADGSRIAREGLLVPVQLYQRSTLALQLGAESAPGAIAVDPVTIDSIHRTTAPGVAAAGDISAQMQQVAGAIAAGSMAAAGIVQSLLVAE